MKINTWELENKKEQYKFYYTEDLSHLAKEIKQIIDISPVIVEGTAEKLTDIYLVSGKVKTKLLLECSRCLTTYDYYFENEFSETFIPKDIDINFDNDEEEYLVIDTNEINISLIVEETVSLGLPYIPLCKEDCKGLCNTCGIDLNHEVCKCSNEVIDPRLADLADWFDKD